MDNEKLVVGSYPTIDEEHIAIRKAFDLKSGEYRLAIRITDSKGQHLVVVLTHEGYHKLTHAMDEEDPKLYNHPQRK